MRKLLALLLFVALPALAQQQINLTSQVKGLLPVANGGIGIGTLTGLALGNGTSAFSAYTGTSCTNQFPRSLSAAGAATCATVANTDLANSSMTIAGHSVALGGTQTIACGDLSNGTALCSTSPGTGIATALGVNVGTAGAPVINGGDLGTPSSGTVTNLTGTAAININGTVGATTPTTGAFTTLTLTNGTTALTINTPAATDTRASNITGSTTGAIYSVWQNTSGQAEVAIENSVGADRFTGAAAYSTTFGSQAATAVNIGTSGVARVLVSSAGAVAMPALSSSSAVTTGTVCWSTGTGNLTVDTTTTCLLSSGKYKQDERPLDIGLRQVLALKPVSYQLKAQFNPSRLGEQIGFFAEDVAKVDERLVSKETDGSPHAVRYQQMTALLTKAIQEQQTQINRLSKRLAQIEHRKGH